MLFKTNKRLEAKKAETKKIAEIVANDEVRPTVIPEMANFVAALTEGSAKPSDQEQFFCSSDELEKTAEVPSYRQKMATTLQIVSQICLALSKIDMYCKDDKFPAFTMTFTSLDRFTVEIERTNKDQLQAILLNANLRQKVTGMLAIFTMHAELEQNGQSVRAFVAVLLKSLFVTKQLLAAADWTCFAMKALAGEIGEVWPEIVPEIKRWGVGMRRSTKWFAVIQAFEIEFKK